MKETIVTDRDVKIFELLNKFRVLDAKLIQQLASFSELKHTQRRLSQLTDSDYIGRERDGNTTPYIYFLRQKGMRILNEKSGRNERPYLIRNFSKSSLEHELLVAEISYLILQQNKDLNINDIQTDRDLRKQGYNPDEVGDIRIFKYKVNIEIENTQKTFKRYPSKFAMNENGFGQVWILNGFKTLKRKLNEHINLFIDDRFVEAILLEEVKDYSFDLTSKAEYYYEKKQQKADDEKDRREEVQIQMDLDTENKKRVAERERLRNEQLRKDTERKKSFWKR